MSKDLIIDIRSKGAKIALLENKKLVELSTQKNDTEFSVGDIYLGRVKKLMPGLNAAFIDVGYNKDAFLHYLDLGPQFQSLSKFYALANRAKYIPLHKLKLEKDINKNGKINDALKAGQNIVVQIAKEPISQKGPRLAAEISLAGRNLVLLPFYNKVSVSQKIQSAEERQRLKQLILSIKPNNYGVIVRTVAENKKVADLDGELRGLVKKWEATFKQIANTKPPKLVLSELNRTEAMLRDLLSEEFNSIYINNQEVFNETKQYINSIAPEKTKIVKQYKGVKVPIFDHFGVDKQVKLLFGKNVPFKEGAYLIIEHTEACHVIDVNSGNLSKSNNDQETNALEINLAAAEEIARQLRLRDMGGIIVIDFIDMHKNENQQKLFERVKQLMAPDRAKHHILPLSKFCLMQITRQRVRPELNIDTVETCPTCSGTKEVSPTILLVEDIKSKIKPIIETTKTSKITIRVHPFVAAYLNKGGLFGYNSIAKQWSKKYKKKIEVIETTSHKLLEYNFFDQYNDEIIL